MLAAMAFALSACGSNGSGSSAGADLEACQASGRLAWKLSDTSLSDADLVPLAQEVVDAATGGNSKIRGLADDLLAGTRKAADTAYFGDYTAAMLAMNEACRPIIQAQGAR